MTDSSKWFSQSLGKLIRLFYPFLFWGSLAQIWTLVPLPAIPFVQTWAVSTFLQVSYWIVAAALVWLAVWSIPGWYLTTLPVRTIRKRIPDLLNPFLGNPSAENTAAIEKKIRELLLKAFTKWNVSLMKFQTRFTRGSAKALLFSSLVYIPAFIILTLQIDNFVIRMFGPIIIPQIQSRIVIPDLNSWMNWTYGLILLTFLNFASLYWEQEQFAPFWRTIGTRRDKLALVVGEFQITTRILSLVTMLLSFVLGRSTRTGVECPNDTGLRIIFEELLNNSYGGSPQVFVYASEQLYPPEELKDLEQSLQGIAAYFSQIQPAIFIGVYNGQCVLVAQTQLFDRRRMGLWTGSSSLTKDIAKKSEEDTSAVREYERGR